VSKPASFFKSHLQFVDEASCFIAPMGEAPLGTVWLLISGARGIIIKIHLEDIIVVEYSRRLEWFLIFQAAV